MHWCAQEPGGEAWHRYYWHLQRVGLAVAVAVPVEGMWAAGDAGSAGFVHLAVYCVLRCARCASEDVVCGVGRCTICQAMPVADADVTSTEVQSNGALATTPRTKPAHTRSGMHTPHACRDPALVCFVNATRTAQYCSYWSENLTLKNYLQKRHAK